MSSPVRKEKPILTEAQLDQLSYAINVKILIYLMERPAPLLEIAQELNVAPLEVGYRLRQLVNAGMVRPAIRESASGRSGDKYYEPVIEDLEFIVKPTDDVDRNANQVRLITMLLRKDLLYHALHPNSEGSAVHVRMIGIRCRPEVFERFMEQVIRLEQELEAADDVQETEWYYMTTALYSKPEKGQVKDDGVDSAP